jgi:hypothetical protein
MFRWSAKDGISGERSGVEFTATDSLADLAAEVVKDAQRFPDRYQVELVWLLFGHDDLAVAEGEARRLAAVEGVELPARG